MCQINIIRKFITFWRSNSSNSHISKIIWMRTLTACWLNRKRDAKVSWRGRIFFRFSIYFKKYLNSILISKWINRFSKKGKKYYRTNEEFIFYPELKSLVVKSNTLPECRSLGRIKGLGKIKLALISGVFLNYPKSQSDLLIIGDELSRAKLKHLLESLEAEVGKEINYSVMNSEEFKYRTDMLDKFIMDFLESPYEEIICKVSNLREIANRRHK